MRLKGKGAFITGGGGSIGRTVALLLAKKGISVAVADLNGEAARNVAHESQRQGGVSFGIGCDVTRKTDVTEAINQANENLGPIDILVNCAGIYPQSLVKEMPEEEWKSGDTDYTVPARLAFHALAAVEANCQKEKPPFFGGRASRFGIDWQNSTPEQLPGKDEMLDYLTEVKKKATDWLNSLSDQEMSSSQVQFNGIAANPISRMLHMMRHCHHHLGEYISELRSRGVPLDLWQ